MDLVRWKRLTGNSISTEIFRIDLNVCYRLVSIVYKRLLARVRLRIK